MSKYYIPEIEEFHVGFEYEYKSRLSGLRNMMQQDKDIEYVSYWRKADYLRNTTLNKIFTNAIEPTDLKEVKVDIENKTIRVKYLDREDIENLGWVYNTWSFVDGGLLIEDNGKYTLFHKGGNKYEITIPSLGFHTDKGFIHYIVFVGTIKNKSELKKLMKQLNIK